MGSKAMLIDGGTYDAGPAVVSYLKRSGIDSIDVLVSTHPHEDHVGGLLTVLNELPVKQVVDSGLAT
jgi:competence protein ComEC